MNKRYKANQNFFLNKKIRMGEIINTTALGFEEQLIRIKQQSRKLIRIKNAFIQTTAAATP